VAPRGAAAAAVCLLLAPAQHPAHPPPTAALPAATVTHCRRYCAKGDSIVALHRIGNASVIKIVDIK
jgi:hypothetical protein